MKPLSPLQRRAERRNRNQSMVDMNLVSLIDVFTILIFFLLSNAGGVETLASPRAVKLPESMSQQAPKETLMITVTATEILVAGRVVASVSDAMKVDGDLIQPLKADLDVEASREVIRKENEADSKRVTVMGDKDIPYRLLRKVMATAARAGYTDVSFAVRQRFEP
jgi:biopolymer transport protein ExbD